MYIYMWQYVYMCNIYTLYVYVSRCTHKHTEDTAMKDNKTLQETKGEESDSQGCVIQKKQG